MAVPPEALRDQAADRPRCRYCYAAERDYFRTEKARQWSERRFQRRVNDAFDLHPDGERFAVVELRDTEPDHVT
jgi:hypothetical protein